MTPEVAVPIISNADRSSSEAITKPLFRTPEEVAPELGISKLCVAIAEHQVFTRVWANGSCCTGTTSPASLTGYANSGTQLTTGQLNPSQIRLRSPQETRFESSGLRGLRR